MLFLLQRSTRVKTIYCNTIHTSVWQLWKDRKKYIREGVKKLDSTLRFEPAPQEFYTWLTRVFNKIHIFHTYIEIQCICKLDLVLFYEMDCMYISESNPQE